MVPATEFIKLWRVIRTANQMAAIGRVTEGALLLQAEIARTQRARAAGEPWAEELEPIARTALIRYEERHPARRCA